MYDNVALHHIPNFLAPSVLAEMLFYAFCAGAVFLEIVLHIRYDWILLRRPGWRDPVKAISRFSYMYMRYGCFAFLLWVSIYTNVPGLDCGPAAQASNVLWVLPLIFVEIIFLQRTMALYGWSRPIVVSLGTMWAITSGLCAYAISTFGAGYKNPFGDFCGYWVLSHVQPHAGFLIAYAVCSITFDTVILLLTIHRLVEGGLLNLGSILFRDRSIDDTSSLDSDRATSLSGLIIKQGVGYYIAQELSRVIFLAVYYSVDNTALYQVVAAGLLATIGPIMAANLYRETTNAVRRTALVPVVGGYGSHARDARHDIVSLNLPVTGGAVGGTTAASANASSALPMAEKTRSASGDSGGAFVYNATAANGDLERGRTLGKGSDDAFLTDDEEIYGAGGYFNRKSGARSRSRSSGELDENRNRAVSVPGMRNSELANLPQLTLAQNAFDGDSVGAPSTTTDSFAPSSTNAQPVTPVSTSASLAPSIPASGPSRRSRSPAETRTAGACASSNGTGSASSSPPCQLAGTPRANTLSHTKRTSASSPPPSSPLPVPPSMHHALDLARAHQSLQSPPVPRLQAPPPKSRTQNADGFRSGPRPATSPTPVTQSFGYDGDSIIDVDSPKS